MSRNEQLRDAMSEAVQTYSTAPLDTDPATEAANRQAMNDAVRAYAAYIGDGDGETPGAVG